MARPHTTTAFAVTLVLLALAAPPVQAGDRIFANGFDVATPPPQTGDRIFADGFDPCCRIGGAVSGLTGTGLVLHLDAGAIHADLPVTANGAYRFAASVAPGTAYSLGFTSQASGQACAFTIAGGTMGSSDIDNADVICGGNLQWDGGSWGEHWN